MNKRKVVYLFNHHNLSLDIQKPPLAITSKR